MRRLFISALAAAVLHTALFVWQPEMDLFKNAPESLLKPIEISMHTLETAAMKKPAEKIRLKQTRPRQQQPAKSPNKKSMSVKKHAPKPISSTAKNQDRQEKKKPPAQTTARSTLHDNPEGLQKLETRNSNMDGETKGTSTADNTEGKPQEKVVVRPLYKNTVPPRYPSKAKRRGYQGIVHLSALISEKGKINELKLFKSSGHELLDRQAMNAVRVWSFEPGRVNGLPEPMWVTIPVKFSLQ